MSYPQKALCVCIYFAVGLWFNGFDQKIVDFVAIVAGGIFLWTILDRPPKPVPAPSVEDDDEDEDDDGDGMHYYSDPKAGQMQSAYANKEVSMRLFDGTQVKGKMAGPDKVKRIDGYIHLLDVQMIQEDEDHAIKSEDLKDEMHFDADQVMAIGQEDMDKVTG